MLARQIDPEVRAPTSPSSSDARALPGRRARRGRLPGLPAEQRHLRPAPGRPQPDGPGQGPVRVAHPRAARHVRPRRRDLQPGLGPHHHPAERPVPLRAARAGARRCCGTWPRSASPPGRRAATPSATSWAATWPAPAPSRCSTSARGPRPPSGTSCTIPYAQRLPRKFKINFSGCATDCGQAMFNDVGVDRRRPARSPTAPSSPASGCSSPAASAPTRTRPRPSRSSPPARSCCATIEACLRVFDHHGNRDNKLRARMKWLVDTMGIDELRRRIFKERKFLLASSHLARRASRRSSPRARRRPRGSRPRASTPTAIGRARR